MIIAGQEEKPPSKKKKLIIVIALLLPYITLFAPKTIADVEIKRTIVKYRSIGKVIVTGYNAVRQQTDNTPCIAASGMNVCKVKEDICACPRKYKFGTKFLIAGKVYNCQDRLHKKYDDRIDLLMATPKEAKTWGKKILNVKIIQ